MVYLVWGEGVRGDEVADAFILHLPPERGSRPEGGKGFSLDLGDDGDVSLDQVSNGKRHLHWDNSLDSKAILALAGGRG